MRRLASIAAAGVLQIFGASVAVAAASPIPAQDSDVAVRVDEELAQARRSMSSAKQALAAATSAQRDAAALKAPSKRAVAQSTAVWLRAQSLYLLGRGPEALPEVSATLNSSDLEFAEPRLRGDLLLVRARIQRDRSIFGEALKDYQDAFSVYEKAKLPRQQALALSGIGVLYENAEQYDRALHYYQSAQDTYNDDPLIYVSNENDIALVLRKLGKYALSAHRSLNSLNAAKRLGDPDVSIQLLENIVVNMVAQGRLADAEAYFSRVLALAGPGWKTGGHRGAIFKMFADIAFHRGRIDDAKRNMDLVFQSGDLPDAVDEAIYYHKLAYDIYKASGEESKALQQMELLHQRTVAALKLAASAEASLSSSQFDFANQNLKIASLKAGQLERDVKLAETRFNALIGGFIAFGVIVTGLIVFVIFLLRGRKALAAAHSRLEISNTFLEKALKAKTEFLATVSHELRTPLNGILGMIQVVAADGAVDPEVKVKMKLAQEAGGAMTSLIDDILDAAQLESAKLSISPEPMNLEVFLQSVAKFWSMNATAKHLAFETAYGELPKRIVSDERRLKQIIFNLLSNAIKFTHEGRIVLSVAEDRAGEKPVLIFRVQDTGIGIPADRLGDIFGAFEQIDGGVTRHYGGSGLGLSICKGLCNLMGATIEVESEEGVGSLFTVRLPLIEAQEDADPNTSFSDHDPMARAHLLIIEASPMAQSLLRVALHGSAGAITMTGSVTEGRSLALSGQFDLVAMGLDAGPESLAALEEIAAQCPTIVLTTAELIDSAVAAGAITAICRPAPIPVLKEALLSAMKAQPATSGASEASRDQRRLGSP